MLDELLESAGDLSQPPPPPEKGIPRQWVPALVRNFFRCLFLPFILLDLAAQRIARIFIPPPYKRVGKCKKRGNCCYYILIRKGKWMPKFIDLFWHTQINGFYRRDRHVHYVNGMPFYLMGCRHLKKDGSCGSYRLRPMICRTWPRIDYFGPPQVLKGCGFRPASNRGKDPLNILQD